jgi:hypothetical protein
MNVLVAVVCRPRLWRSAVLEMLLTARTRWWRRWPFLPLPGSRWVQFRLECATGNRDGRLAAQDVVAWLEWCKATALCPR